MRDNGLCQMWKTEENGARITYNQAINILYAAEAVMVISPSLRWSVYQNIMMTYCTFKWGEGTVIIMIMMTYCTFNWGEGTVIIRAPWEMDSNGLVFKLSLWMLNLYCQSFQSLSWSQLLGQSYVSCQMYCGDWSAYDGDGAGITVV